jgi:ribose-phosphate pyrophosphokinase
MITLNGYNVTPTTFPDTCTQVWKLPEDVYNKMKITFNNVIEWDFDKESELITIAQLRFMIGSVSEKLGTLRINYLPYGRQDKEVSNDSTFGIHPFAHLINSLNFSTVYLIDAHSDKHGIANCINEIPYKYIQTVTLLTGTDVLIYPDKGASVRYSKLNSLTNIPSIYFNKVREQSTGKILSLEADSLYPITNKKCLIVDDICDGGATFIQCAKQLYKMGASEVYLYTTHGIYSRGSLVLFEEGIKRVFNFKGEVE